MGPGGSTKGYLGYGPIQYDRSRRRNVTKRPGLNPGSTFTFTLSHPSAERLREALEALWLLCALGGCGSRSRRGWGGLTLSAVTTEPHGGDTQPSLFDGLPVFSQARSHEELADLIDQGLRALVPEARRQNLRAHDLQRTAIGAKTLVRVLKPSSATQNWGAALTQVGGLLKEFRHAYGRNRYGGRFKQRFKEDGGPGPDYHLSRKALESRRPPAHLPERAGFGLPYVQGFRSLDDDTARFLPAGDKHDRRASPLFLRIHRLANRCHVAVVAFLPAKFLPDNEKVTAVGTWGRAALAPPGPFGVSRKAAGKSGTLVLDFIKVLRGRSGATALDFL